MKHFITSTSWAYNSMAMAYTVRYGVADQDIAFVPLVNVRPKRQLLNVDLGGRLGIANGADSGGERLVSTLALPENKFRIKISATNGDFTIHADKGAATTPSCLLFSECRSAESLIVKRSTGKVLCMYRRFYSGIESIVFAATMLVGEEIVFERYDLPDAILAFDGRNLIQAGGFDPEERSLLRACVPLLQ